MTWQRDDPAFYEKEKAEVEAHFPSLHFVVEDDLVYVRGSFPVMFEGQALDHYMIELESRAKSSRRITDRAGDRWSHPPP